MVPNALIMLVLMVAFGIGWTGYFLSIGSSKRLLLSNRFLSMGAPAAIMLLTVILAVVDVRLVWLSWVLLAIAILLIVAAVPQYRKARAMSKAHAREITERRARGG
jgi:hypothetical protein